MTEPETTHPIPENEHPSPATTNETAVLDTDAEPPPEPWTPERVTEWNAYYDVYVKLAALLLVFMVSCNYVADPQVWLHLKAGQLIGEQGWPVKTDVFSYTEQGRPWIDIHWLFEWTNAALYKLVNGLVPVNPADPTANRDSAEQIAVGSLVVVQRALMRLATAWLLLKIRRPGPGPLVVGHRRHRQSGRGLQSHVRPRHGRDRQRGVRITRHLGRCCSSRSRCTSSYRAYFQGRPRALWLLVPTFVLWANIDMSFLNGLAGAPRGRRRTLARWQRQHRPDGSSAKIRGQKGTEPRARDRNQTPPGRSSLFVILGVCALACLVNPFTYQAYVDAVFPYRPVVPADDQDHDVRSALVLRTVDSQQRGARLVLASGFLYHRRALGSRIISLEFRNGFPGPGFCRSR